MALGYDIKIKGDMRKQLRGTFGKYEFEVGILKDSVHRKAKIGAAFSSLAGGPVRKKGTLSDKLTSDISRSLREKLKFNYLVRPFKAKNNADILRFSKSFFELCLGKGQKKRCENLIQAIVRNPITRGDYGSNTKLTASIKGFNRLMIDTGQFFKSITARTKVKNVSK